MSIEEYGGTPEFEEERQLFEALNRYLDLAIETADTLWRGDGLYHVLGDLQIRRGERRDHLSDADVAAMRTVVARDARTAVFERDAYRCQVCGDWRDLTIDHVIPRTLGGTNELTNLQTLCRTCNSRKGARVPASVVATEREVRP